jgi:hypothetical protein
MQLDVRNRWAKMPPNSPLKRDNSDKKSLDNLMDTLKKLQDSAKKDMLRNRVKKDELQDSTKKNKPQGSPMKDKPQVHTSPSSRKRRSKTQNSKITPWLNKENSTSKRCKTDRMKPLDITIKSKKTLQRNPSFEKYGIMLPSYDKIVADQKKFDEHKNSVKLFDDFDVDVLDKGIAVDLDEGGEFADEILDCKHLSPKELDEFFAKNVQILDGIIKGKNYSERHRRFHRGGRPDEPGPGDLRCSTSLVVFTYDQKDHLLNLLRDEFDPEDKMTVYFFKVLLPELCLLIFMEVHKMGKRKANAYLDRRPLDN